MTRDDVIRLAKEAGVINPSPYTAPWEHEQLALERFALLIAAADRDACAELVAELRQNIRAIGAIPCAQKDALDQAEAAIRARAHSLQPSANAGKKPDIACAVPLDEPLFYVQDSRSYVGNDVLWWASGGNGYTSDLSKAQTYTLGQAQAMHDSRHSDIPWPKAYVDAKTRPAVDMQYIRRNEALCGSGITLVEPMRERKETIHCQHCGSFLTQNQVFFGCPKCGGTNAP